MKIKDFSAKLVDLIFPPRCIFCGKVISSGTRACEKCGNEISCINTVKGIYIPSAEETIPCAVPYIYKDEIRQSIINFKFYGQKQFADFYAERIAQNIITNFADLHFDAITSVPISAKRYKLRGYNQSELLARAASKRLNLPYCEYLVKTTDNEEQHKLNEKQRQKNVKGVYKTISEDQIVGKSILLIDDIVTTGATLRECAAVLFRSGAADIACAAIAEVYFN